MSHSHWYQCISSLASLSSSTMVAFGSLHWLIHWINRFRNQWCLSPLEKSSVKQTGQQTMDTHTPVGVSICGCLSVFRKSYISHRTFVSVQLTGLQCLFSFSLFRLWCTVGICLRAELTNYFETKKSIRIDVDWCCSGVCLICLLTKKQRLVVALGLLLLSLQSLHL